MRNCELRAINLRERNKGGDEKLTGPAGMGAIGTTKTGTEGTVEMCEDLEGREKGGSPRA